MSHEAMAGLVQDPRFQFFDHFEVVRTNLSRDEAPAPPKQVRPGFLPVLADLGGAAPAFRLLAPRFDFTDQLAEHAAPGDLLLYRVTAIDAFGQRSLTTEYVATRRDLRVPAAPRRAEAAYEVQLAPGSATGERLAITLVEPSPGARHEVWLRSYPIGAGGYFGVGDDVDDDPASVVSAAAADSQGMTPLGALPPGATELVLGTAELAALGHGALHELYVRAVSAEGAASRLLRCEHTARITGAAPGPAAPRPQAFFERVPAPTAPYLAAWVAAEDLRVEARRAPVPRPGALIATELEHAPADDPSERQVVLRLLHERSLDPAGAHPTGGYEVHVRDRDASAGDEARAYQRLAEVEVVSLARFAASPHTTAAWSSWRGRYLRAGEAAAFTAANALGDGVDAGWLDWGALLGSHATPSGRIATMPEDGLLHAHLEQLLYDLEQAARAAGLELIVHSTPPGREQTAERSLAKLLDEHTEDKDPDGAGVLAVLGRSVDVFLGKAGAPLPASELVELVRAVADPRRDELAHCMVLVERLLHGDRSTPLAYVRLSLQPRIVAFPPPGDGAAEPDALRRAAFERFCTQLAGFGFGPAGTLDPDAQDRYEQLARRFLRRRPISPAGGSVAVGVAYYDAGGALERPLHDDDTVSVPLYYKDEYARRFAYRVRRLGRYARLYRELGLWPAEADAPGAPADPGPAATVVVRLPRVKPPAPPVAIFLGSLARPGAPPTAEWLVEEHEEEAMVQSNETLRNRLGFRGLAWTLHAEARAEWLRWSGWTGDGPASTPEQRAILSSDAAWDEPGTGAPALPAGGALRAHPFLGLLQPKGTVVRVPRLPYYYRYRLAAFARTDDVDSAIKIADAAQVLPEHVAAIDEQTAGWRVVRPAGGAEPARIELWWRVPPVWQSLAPADRAIWANEEPFASRLWDFDLEFTVELERHQCRSRLLGARLAPERSGASAAYGVTTGAAGFYDQDARRVERLPDAAFPSPQLPELRIQVHLVERLAALLVRPDELVFDLLVSRSYGRGQPRRARLVHRETEP